MFVCWVIFCCFIGFDNLVTVLGCSIVTDSMSNMFGFSMISSFWVIICDCVSSFNKLEVVLGCLAVLNFVTTLFGVL